MPYFALIIMFYHVKIACYQRTLGMKILGVAFAFGQQLTHKHQCNDI